MGGREGGGPRGLMGTGGPDETFQGEWGGGRAAGGLKFKTDSGAGGT